MKTLYHITANRSRLMFSVVSVLLATSLACNAGAGEPTQTLFPIPTSTSIPTATPAPTSTFTPTPTMSLSVSTDTPKPDLIIAAMGLGIVGQQGNCVVGNISYEIGVAVENVGDADSDAFVVALNGIRQTISAGLPAGQRIWLHFGGGMVPSNEYVASVDDTNLISESDESNNTQSYIGPTLTPPRFCTPTATP